MVNTNSSKIGVKDVYHKPIMQVKSCPDYFLTFKTNNMTKAEEIYHRFVQYEWNEIGEGMKQSILEAINEALNQPTVLSQVDSSQNSNKKIPCCDGYGCCECA